MTIIIPYIYIYVSLSLSIYIYMYIIYIYTYIFIHIYVCIWRFPEIGQPLNPSSGLAPDLLRSTIIYLATACDVDAVISGVATKRATSLRFADPVDVLNTHRHIHVYIYIYIHIYVYIVYIYRIYRHMGINGIATAPWSHLLTSVLRRFVAWLLLK